jgi:membrane associated rhomboid family serine protease
MQDSSSKPLKFACACGKRLAVAPELAGRRVRCPKCRAPIVVPSVAPPAAHSELDDLFPTLSEGETQLRLAPVDSPPATADRPAPLDAGDGKTCPSCGKGWPKSAKICVACGIDLKTGRAIEMKDDSHINSAYVYAENVIWWLSWPNVFGFFPIASEAFGVRRPWVVRGVALLTAIVTVWFWIAYDRDPQSNPGLASLMMWSGDHTKRTELLDETRKELRAKGAPEDAIQELLAELEKQPVSEFRWYQPLTAAFLHADFSHIAFNLLFLFVLGSRVNMLIGNALTLILYPVLAFASGLAHHLSMHDQPLTPYIGASGAINGLAGLYLVLLPASTVHMAVWLRPWVVFLFRLHLWIFPMRGFWVVALFLALDSLFLYLGWGGNVAHWAHLGGAAAGMLLGVVLLMTRLVDARGGDLLSVSLGRFAWKLIGPPSAKRRVLW